MILYQNKPFITKRVRHSYLYYIIYNLIIKSQIIKKREVPKLNKLTFKLTSMVNPNKKEIILIYCIFKFIHTLKPKINLNYKKNMGPFLKKEYYSFNVTYFKNKALLSIENILNTLMIGLYNIYDFTALPINTKLQKKNKKYNRITLKLCEMVHSPYFTLETLSPYKKHFEGIYFIIELHLNNLHYINIYSFLKLLQFPFITNKNI